MTTIQTPLDSAQQTGPLRAAAGAVRTAQKHVPLVQIAGIILCGAYGASQVPGFLTSTNLITIGVLASLLAIASLGQTVVMMIGGIDLSVGNMLTAGAVLVPTAASRLHLPFVVAAVIGIVVAAAVGAVSGWISDYFRVHSLIITLAVGTCVQGAILVVTHGTPTGSVPNWLSNLTMPSATTLGLGVPPVIVIWIALVAVTSVIFYRTVLGRQIFALGTNRRASSLALVRTRALWVGVFAFSAAAALAAGVLVGSFSGSGDVNVGNSYLFQSVAAVLIGGTLMEGGRGDFIRTAVGAMLMTTISTTLTSLNYDASVIQILSGVLIFVVVLNSSRERSARDRV